MFWSFLSTNLGSVYNIYERTLDRPSVDKLFSEILTFYVQLISAAQLFNG